MGARTGRRYLRSTSPDVHIDNVVRPNGERLGPVLVVPARVLIGKIRDYDPARTGAAAAPVVPVHLVGLGHVEHFLARYVVERQPLRLGQPGEHHPLERGERPVSSWHQLEDLAVPGVADQQLALRAPGFEAGPGHPRPIPPLASREGR